MYTAQVGAYTADIGQGYLFPALAAVFFGASQLSQRPNVWGTLIAFFAQVYVIYLCIIHMDFLGGGLRFADYIIWIDLAVLVVGVLYAFYIKAADPEKYDKIGRLIYEGVPERP